MLLREDYRTEEHNVAKPQPQEVIVSAEKSQGSRLTQLLLRKVQCQRRNDQKINESAFREAVGRQALPPIPTILIHASGRVCRPPSATDFPREGGPPCEIFHKWTCAMQRQLLLLGVHPLAQSCPSQAKSVKHGVKCPYGNKLFSRR
jgi:hypothetical protein